MKIIIENITPIIVLSINLIASISYFIIYSKPDYKRVFFALPKLIQKIYVAFFVLPLFIAPFVAQPQFLEKNTFCLILGVLVSIIGLLIIVLSFLKIGLIPSIKIQDGLSTSGVYSIVRHPIYFGTITTQIGLIIFNLSLISLLYLPISIILYYAMATIEEKDLAGYFGDEYIDYKLNVKKKILPYII